MVTLTCAADRHDGVTLVTARLEGSGVAQRVRLANRLDGPVWPPRRQGVPEAGWDDDGFETVVSPDDAVAVGYASPAPPTDPPLAIVDREIVDGGDSGDGHETAVTPREVLRDLGDPSPPRDAVPLPVEDADEATANGGDADADEGERAPEGETARGSDRAAERRRSDVPADVNAWFDAVEERVAVAERLATAETVPEATAAVREAGGLADAESLVETLRRDAVALDAVADRAGRLADRTSAADVPLETYERLA